MARTKVKSKLKRSEREQGVRRLEVVGRRQPTNDGCLRMRVAGRTPVRNMSQVHDVRVGPCACNPLTASGLGCTPVV